jgi:hypothetical protein
LCLTWGFEYFLNLLFKFEDELVVTDSNYKNYKTYKYTI